MCADPKSAKRQQHHMCLFALLGSMQVKAARKTVVKSTPEEEKEENTLLKITFSFVLSFFIYY